MSERLKFEGRLAEKKREQQKAALRIRALVNGVRDLLDPFAPIEDLRADQAAELTLELANLHIDYTRLAAEIAALKKALGR